MSNEKKSDYKEFHAFIDELQNFSWLEPSQKWWPKFIFHFTNINNAIKILEDGKLLSRSQLEQTQGMKTDNASPDVISHTDDKWRDYVRLYFRPRTPTQNKNEGFRPRSQRELNSHCPVPIYFLFDSKKLLERENVYFSKQSLALSGASIYHNINDFKSIPFHFVYHDSWFNPEQRYTIVSHRHAEVVVHKELDLDDLKYIWCRSEAEYKTLLNLLSDQTKRKWKDKIGGGKKGNLFFRNWLFVENVDLNTNTITFKFNLPNQNITESLHFKVEVIEVKTEQFYLWEDPNYIPVKHTLEISLSKMKFPEHYRVKLYIDDQIMYSDEFIDYDLPF